MTYFTCYHVGMCLPKGTHIGFKPVTAVVLCMRVFISLCVHASHLRIANMTQREKERDLTQPHDENPYTNTELNSQWSTQKRHQNFDDATIADQLRTVSWSNNSHPAGVVKPVYGYPTFPLTAKAV